MRLLEPLRRLIGPPAKQPELKVVVNISPETVIRPGDTVVVCLPDPLWVKPGVINAAKKWLPTGAGIVVFCGEGSSAFNVSRAFKEILDSHRGERGCDGHPQDVLGTEETHDGRKHTPPSVDGLANGIDGVGRLPEAFLEPLRKPHTGVSP